MKFQSLTVGLRLFSPLSRLQVSEVEVNGQIEAVCESVFSEMESQAVNALDLPVPGCFRMRSHSYVRAIEKGCSQDEEGEGPGSGGVVVVATGAVAGGRRSGSPPRGSTTTVRTIQSSTGGPDHGLTHLPLWSVSSCLKVLPHQEPT